MAMSKHLIAKSRAIVQQQATSSAKDGSSSAADDAARGSAQRPSTQPLREEDLPIADRIDAIAGRLNEKFNRSSIAIALRQGLMPVDAYKRFITNEYPLVVGFNEGIIRSILKLDDARHESVRDLVHQLQKVDHVNNSAAVRVLAGKIVEASRGNNLKIIRPLCFQLAEEQEHNDFYRYMLEAHGVDHKRAHAEFIAQIQSVTKEDLGRMVANTLMVIKEGKTPRAFPGVAYPPAVVALCCYLARAAEDPTVPFFVYNAMQSAIEFGLVKVVSDSIFPGIVGPKGHLKINGDLAPDAKTTSPGEVPASIRWWDEHATYGKGGAVELSHIALSKKTLNEGLEPVDYGEALRRAEDVLLLFSATIAWRA